MLSPYKQFVISIDELWADLQKYETSLVFAEDGLNGVIQSFLSLNRQDPMVDEYGRHQSWIDYSVDQVMGDLSWQFDNLLNHNACPIKVMDIDLGMLELMIVDIAEHIDGLFKQYFSCMQYTVKTIERLRGKTTYCVVLEVM